jgi:tagatose 6-phosphate kinase
MIVTVTLNPMLDKTVFVDSIARGRIQRADRVSAVVGGKGVNVARQLLTWNCESTATGFLGGEIGTLIERMLADEKIPQSFVRVKGMTREGVTYVEHDHTMTSIFEPPHEVTREEVEMISRHLTTLLEGTGWMIFSGSSPWHVTDDIYPVGIAAARRHGVRTVLDSYGETFSRAVVLGPDIVKPNREEFEQTFGATLQSEKDVVAGLRHMTGVGVKLAIITDGPRPSYAATSGSIWKITPPQVRVVDATGSGDSCIAGVVFGSTQGWGIEQQLVFGIAAGAANARRRSVADAPRDEVESLMTEVHLETIP